MIEALDQLQLAAAEILRSDVLHKRRIARAKDDLARAAVAIGAHYCKACGTVHPDLLLLVVGDTEDGVWWTCSVCRTTGIVEPMR